MELGDEMISVVILCAGSSTRMNQGKNKVLLPLNNKPIFITSNLDYNLLREHLSSTKDDINNIKSNRILERIKQMTKRVCFDEQFKK